jgi:hypothetical protein
MKLKTTIDDCPLLDLGKIHNRAGNITVVDMQQNLPFNVKRIYYLYDIPGGAERGGHAHKELYQIIVAASGSFSVLIDDGNDKSIINLNHPNRGLLIKPGIWRELINFSSGSICLVIASDFYNESDYIREYEDFLFSKKQI